MGVEVVNGRQNAQYRAATYQGCKEGEAGHGR